MDGVQFETKIKSKSISNDDASFHMNLCLNWVPIEWKTVEIVIFSLFLDSLNLDTDFKRFTFDIGSGDECFSTDSLFRVGNDKNYPNFNDYKRSSIGMSFQLYLRIVHVESHSKEVLYDDPLANKNEFN